MNTLPKNLQRGLVVMLNGNVSGSTHYDVSGNANNATIAGSISYQRRLQSSTAPLDGSTKYEYRTSSTPTLSGITEYSAFAFVKFTSTAALWTIAAVGAETAVTLWYLGILFANLSSAKISWGIFQNSVGGEWMNSTRDMNDWQWHFIVGTRNGSSHKLYIDWALDNSWTFTSNATSYAWYVFWARTPTPIQQFNWDLGTRGIYNRELSSVEVNELRNSLYIK